jgi:hypothetical protein
MLRATLKPQQKTCHAARHLQYELHESVNAQRTSIIKHLADLSTPHPINCICMPGRSHRPCMRDMSTASWHEVQDRIGLG